MSRQEIYNEKLNRINTAFKRQKPDRVPVAVNIFYWAVKYYGYSVREAYYDKPQLCSDIYSKLADEFDFDAFFTGYLTAPIPAMDILGGGHYLINDDGIQVSNKSANLMKEDEYPLLSEHFEDYWVNTLLKRKFPLLSENKGKSVDLLKESYEKLNWFLTQKSYVNTKLKEHGIPMMGVGGLFHPIDFIMDYFRDFSGIMADIRRRPIELKKCLDVLNEYLLKRNCPGHIQCDEGQMMFWPMHLATYLKPKDFEEFYFPYMRSQLDYAMNVCDNKVGMWLENLWEPYYGILQDLPGNNGKLLGLIEKGDLKKYKDKLGHKLCVCGGIPSNLLAFGTARECTELVNRLVGECAAGGGVILSMDKGLMASGDAKAENLKAVIDAVKEYGKY